MSMPALASAVPPESPVVVACLPDESMETRMFSTDCVVREGQLSQAAVKTELWMLDGFQLSNTPAEKSVSEMQLCQACRTLFVDGSGESKLVRDWQLYQARYKLPAVGNGVLNEVSPLDCHALLKFTLLALVPSFASAGNDVRAVVPFHVNWKAAPSGALIAPKSLIEIHVDQA